MGWVELFLPGENLSTVLLLQVWRDFRSHFHSFVLSISTMALGIALLVALSSAYLNLGISTERAYQRLQFLDLSCHLRNAPMAAVDRALSCQGVAAAEGRRSLGLRVVLQDGERVKGLALGIPTERCLTVNQLHLVSGQNLSNARGQALLEARFAQAYGYRVGDWLTLESQNGRRRFQVAGLACSPEFLWLAPERLDPRPAARRFGVVWLAHRDIAALSGSDVINEIHIRLKAGVDPGAVSQSLSKRLQGLMDRPIETRQEQPSHSLLERDRRAFALIASIFPLVLLCLSGLMLFVSLWQLLHLQRKSIGVLLSLGMSRARLVRQYATLTAFLCLQSIVLGGLLGPPLGRQATRFYVDTLGLPLQVEHWPWPSLWVAAVAAILIAALACAAALLDLIRQPAVALLRQEFSAQFVYRWPRGVSRSARNCLRHPWRSLTMLLGTGLASALMLMTLALQDSEASTLSLYLNKIHRYDLKVDLEGQLTSNQLPPVEGWRGVERVERGLVVEARLHHQRNSLTCGIWGLPADSKLLQLYDQQGQPLQPQRNQGLLMPPLVRRKLGLETQAQELTLELANGQLQGIEQQVRLGPGLYEPILGPPKCEIGELQRYLAHGCSGPSEVFNVMLIAVTPGALPEVRHRLHQDRRVSKIETMLILREDLNVLLRMVNAYFGLMVLCAGLMAAAVLHLCTTLNLRERRCEVALMLVQGVRVSQVLTLLSQELLLLWGLGSFLGICLGQLAGDWLLRHYQSDLIDLRLHLSAQSVLLTTAASLLVFILAAWWPVRQLLRPDLSQVTRSPD